MLSAVKENSFLENGQILKDKCDIINFILILMEFNTNPISQIYLIHLYFLYTIETKIINDKCFLIRVSSKIKSNIPY